MHPLDLTAESASTPSRTHTESFTEPLNVPPSHQWARALWSAAEPLTLAAYFTPEAAAILETAGLSGGTALIPLRAAPLGQAAPAVVAAAFAGFPPETLAAVLTPTYTALTAASAITGMHQAVVSAAHRQLPHLVPGDQPDQVDPRVSAVAEDLTQAVAALDVTGRPLAAGGQAITATGSPLAPAHPWARLWRASNTLREYRGDAHVAVLIAAALPRLQAEVLTAAWLGEQIDVAALKATRSIEEPAWKAAAAQLTQRGLLDAGGAITAEGRALRQRIETATDAASAAPWAHLGAQRTRAAWDLFLEASAALVDSGQMRGTTPVGSPWPPIAPV